MKKKYPIKILGGLILGEYIYTDILPLLRPWSGTTGCWKIFAADPLRQRIQYDDWFAETVGANVCN